MIRKHKEAQDNADSDLRRLSRTLFRQKLPGNCMQNRVLEIAASVIAKSDRSHPADAVLRTKLRKQKSLPPEQSRETARAVFAYYRWMGWLDRRQPISKQLRQAVELADRFQHEPGGFSSEDLLAKAIPPWTSLQVNVTVEWIHALQTEPKLWLRTRPGQGKAVATKLGDCQLSHTLADALCYEGTKDLFRTPEFQAGEFELQDISSQAVGLICNPRPAETWWDACAGEGGKTLHLSDLMRNQGLIWASDKAEWRLQKLKQRAARAKVFNYRTALWNGAQKLPTKTKFNGVLVDAPCSGLGTWQRNPQARWTTGPQDVEELGTLQERLLANVVPGLKPGGRLIYAVCTLTRRETTDVAASLQRRFPELQPLIATDPFGASPPSAHHWLWPKVTYGNGMFVAAWQK
ncbi:MAG: RsmB/NOP family class I SAM-dependent RNA methyltransferase [Verrucomicrobia bacterium]|nr:RsmB/NOP family class I SAM-dependent RNA methyltransferase [Verrucomicrobiota bacterium]